MRYSIAARPIALFLLLALGGAWLVASPLWVSGQGLRTPGAPVLLVAMMFIPAFAAGLVHLTNREDRRFLEITSLKRRLPFRRWAPYAVIAWLGPIVATLGSLVVAAALGAYRFDLEHFSGAREAVSAVPGASLPDVPIQALVALQIGAMLVAPILNAIPALGEEIGWRGFLQTRLLPLGQWPAMLITGAVWGLWHAPVILLGYNYPGHNPVAALGLMMVFCMLLSVLLGWLTLASGTVWTAAIAHGFMNGAASLGVLLASAGPIDAAVTGLLGVSGWAVMIALIVLLILLRQLPVVEAGERKRPRQVVSPD